MEQKREMMNSSLELTQNTLTCQGFFDKKHIPHLFKSYKKINFTKTPLTLDLQKIHHIDTSGAMFILRIKKDLYKQNISINILYNNENTKKLIALCEKNDAPIPKNPENKISLSHSLYLLGKSIAELFTTFLSFISFLGGTSQALLKTLVNPTLIRFRATLYHIETNGLHALPIVALTSLLIGMVIAYQGAVQLEKFGANIFIVEMVSISATRELAPLIVAIVIAGRSASSFTAQLGVMKITDEVDAMKTLGFNEWEFLILPRVIALIVALPLLVVFADALSVFGGMIVASSELDVSFYEFISRLKETVDLRHIIIGLAKAPVFGWIIATIGCFRGFQIIGNTESVGKYTTMSVVSAVFWVIAFDALTSIFLTQVGL